MSAELVTTYKQQEVEVPVYTTLEEITKAGEVEYTVGNDSEGNPITATMKKKKKTSMTT